MGTLAHDRLGLSEHPFQLGFVGSSDYPLWALTASTLTVVVLYALTARWSDSRTRSPRCSNGLFEMSGQAEATEG
jgi:hypothetical protein